MLKNTLFVLGLLFVGNALSAQTTAAPAPAAAPIHIQVDQKATFPGGDAAISKFVADNQRKLNTTRAQVSSTTVVLDIVVEADGRVSRTKASASPNVELEEESVMLLKKMGKWKPAMLNGKAVRSQTSVAITLNLN